VLASIILAACAAPTPAPEADVVTSPRLDRVVVAPLNVPVRTPVELEGKGEPVWQELLRYFQERDRQVAVLSPISAERLWLEATADLEVSDRGAALRAGYSRMAEALAAHRDFDLFVVPSLVLRPAHLSGWHAYWDGAQRIVPNAAILTPSRQFEISGATTIQVAGLRGKVAAVSLHVVVLRPDGTRVYEGLGGLDVLQEARRDDDADSKLRFAVRADPFADPDSVREGVTRAFEGPLLTATRAR
jgi:hypothetical protein